MPRSPAFSPVSMQSSSFTSPPRLTTYTSRRASPNLEAAAEISAMGDSLTMRSGERRRSAGARAPMSGAQSSMRKTLRPPEVLLAGSAYIRSQSRRGVPGPTSAQSVSMFPRPSRAKLRLAASTSLSSLSKYQTFSESLANAAQSEPSPPVMSQTPRRRPPASSRARAALKEAAGEDEHCSSASGVGTSTPRADHSGSLRSSFICCEPSMPSRICAKLFFTFMPANVAIICTFC